MDNEQIITGRAWFFHPSGVKVELPLPSNPFDAYQYVDDCIQAGFLASAPNFDGLDKIDVAYVVRGQKSDDKGTTDRLYFYAAWAQQSSNMTVYLDNADDTARFERASGLKVAELPIIKGKQAPQRESRDFEHYARNVNFTVTRRKVDAKDSPVGYRWELVDYVGSAKPSTSPSDAPNGNGGATPHENATYPPSDAKNATLNKGAAWYDDPQKIVTLVGRFVQETDGVISDLSQAAAYIKPANIRDYASGKAFAEAVLSEFKRQSEVMF
jgi:hypothetical protein